MSYLDSIENNLRKHFFSRPFTVKDAGISYRELFYWEQKGLLPFEVKEHKWRRFNLPELTWLRLVVRLREFGVGIAQIAQIKNRLTKKVTVAELAPDWEQLPILKEILSDPKVSTQDREDLIQKIRQEANEQQSTKFETYLLGLLQHGGSIKIIISINKNSDDNNPFLIDHLITNLHAEAPPISSLEQLLYNDNISIKLDDLIEDILQQSPIKKLQAVFELNEKEQKILELIRSGKYQSIEICYHEKSLNKIITKEQLKVKNDFRLTDFINRQGYHSLKVNTQAGEVVYLERTTSQKL